MNAKTNIEDKSCKSDRKYLYSEFYDRMVGILTGKTEPGNKRLLKEWSNPLSEQTLLNMFSFNPTTEDDNTMYRALSVRRLHPAFVNFYVAISQFITFFINPTDKEAVTKYKKAISDAVANCNQDLPEVKEVAEMFRRLVASLGRKPRQDEMKKEMAQSLHDKFLEVFYYQYQTPVSEFLQEFFSYSNRCLRTWSSVLKRKIMNGSFFENYSDNILHLRQSGDIISGKVGGSRINSDYLGALITLFDLAGKLIDSLEQGLFAAGDVESDDLLSGNETQNEEPTAGENGQPEGEEKPDGEDREGVEEKEEEKKEREEDAAKQAAEEMLKDKSDTGDDDVYDKSFEELGRLVRQGVRIVRDADRGNKEMAERIYGKSYDEVLKSDIDKMLEKIQKVNLNKNVKGEGK